MFQMNLPILYKKDNSGAIISWSIWTIDNVIYTKWGQINSQNCQDTKDEIKEAKSQESPREQAQFDARSKWKKKIDAGYTPDMVKAASGYDEIGLTKPMLAQNFADHAKKLGPEVFVSPKMDGIRALICVDGLDVSLISRNRKEINSVPHITRWFANNLGAEGVKWAFDCELYNHEIRQREDGFNQLQSIIMKSKNLHVCYEDIQAHLFDVVLPGEPYDNRLEVLRTVFAGLSGPFKLVKTIRGQTRQADKYLKWAIEAGYEGIMLRDPKGPYESGKRSYWLQKYKLSFDNDYRIIGAEEGSGKLVGCVGAFICQTEAGETFTCTPAMPESRKRDLWQKPELWRDGWLNIEYQETFDTGVPRFGRGMKIMWEKPEK